MFLASIRFHPVFISLKLDTHFPDIVYPFLQHLKPLFWVNEAFSAGKCSQSLEDFLKIFWGGGIIIFSSFRVLSSLFGLATRDKLKDHAIPNKMAPFEVRSDELVCVLQHHLEPSQSSSAHHFQMQGLSPPFLQGNLVGGIPTPLKNMSQLGWRTSQD